jgi:hypothetical protein
MNPKECANLISHQSQDDPDLFNYVTTSIEEEETFHFLGFEFLHRLNIVQIQNDIARAREDIFRNRSAGADREKLKTLLADYSKLLTQQHEESERTPQKNKNKNKTLTTHDCTNSHCHPELQLCPPKSTT